ncbi:MAG: lantibiotic dehydratase [Jatrophihabitantaceae bacterium]
MRTTGLPADLLNQLSWSDPIDNEQRFIDELGRTSKVMAGIAGLDLFREALAWQNPAALPMVESFARSAHDPKRDAKKRKREYRIARYINRYCGKSETIGFFGPVGWGRLTGEPGGVSQHPGRTLISRRRTFAEPWAVRELAAALADDPQIGAWLPVRVRSHYSVRDGSLYQPRADPLPLSELELAVLGYCDGERPRQRVIEQVAATLGIRQDEVEACLAGLEQRRCVVSGPNVPLSPDCVPVLAARIAAIGDDQVKHRALARIAPFLAALSTLSAASGEAGAVANAQAALGETFREASGTAAARRPGRMYAGRGVAYEDCLRDLDVELGTDFLTRVSEGLPGILAISQWLTWQAATAYEQLFRQEWAAANQRLDAVWFEVMASFFGNRPKPIDDVLTDFRRRWRQLVAQLHASASGYAFDPAEFHDAVERLFPSPGPGWAQAAIHCPDLQLIAHSPDGLRTGDYDVVLSEIHVSTTTITGPVFEWSLGEDYPISRFLQSRIGQRVMPVFPDSWPRNTGRTMPADPMPADLRFAFADVDAAPPDTIAITAIEVGVADGAVFVELPDGARLTFAEFFSFLLSAAVVDAWKNISEGPHTPRISVGRFTIVRQSWRVDVADEFSQPLGEYESYRAVNSWRRSLNCPDRVYVKLPGEVKPFYVDFNSPISVLSYLAALRGTLKQPNGSTELTLSEALPEPAQAWTVDAAGNRYIGELRMVVVADRAQS